MRRGNSRRFSTFFKYRANKEVPGFFYLHNPSRRSGPSSGQGKEDSDWLREKTPYITCTKSFAISPNRVLIS